MSRSGSLIRNIDWVTVGLFLALALFGWLNVYEASYTFDQTSIFDFSFRSGKQIVWIGTALLLGGIILLLDSHIFDRAAYILYAALIPVLIATPLLARDIKGSLSWISLGPVSLQPAEFAKCITALALAKFMGRYDYHLRSWRDMVVPLAIMALPMLIIMVWQKETGSALVLTSFLLMFYREGMSGYVLLTGVAAVVLFVTVIKFGTLAADILIGSALLVALIVRIKPVTLIRNKLQSRARYDRNKFSYKEIIIFAMIAVVAVGYSHACHFAFDHLPDHQRSRVEVLLGLKDDPQGAGYNVKQSLIAIGSGGLTGKGFLKGTQTKMHFVPEQATDFIFCTVGEEWGWIGSSALLVVYLIFILRIIALAERQREQFAQIYGYCVASILLFHLTINIGMVLGLFPVIGIPLPFISYGGSSIWGFTILLFILLRLDAARVDKM